MCTNAEALKSQIKNQASGAFFKNDNDPRITKVGQILRKTSLDELPQFWNVLKGEMSLVGTRPPTPDEVERYEVPQWQRLDVKPGMTGEWQVNGRSQVRDFEDVIRLDLKYQQNWSLMYDLKLIVKTVTILNLPRATPIDLEVKVFASYLEIRIWDRGQPFDLEAKLHSIMKEQRDPLDREGERGLLFMHKLTDELYYNRTDDSRNCLLMRKNII